MQRPSYKAAWRREAFVSVTERLRPFEPRLRGGKLLELRGDREADLGLDWLRPSILVAHDLERGATIGELPPSMTPKLSYGSSASFDAAFLLAGAGLKRALRRTSMPEIARVLRPGGLLIVTALEGPEAPVSPAWEARVERSAEAWSLLHRSLAGSELVVSEEHWGVSRLLVARKRNGGRARRPALLWREPAVKCA